MIYRYENRGFYTRIANAVLRDPQMGLDELGLYAAMLSRPSNWEFRESVLARDRGIPCGEIRRLLKSLERKGYVRERQSRCGPVWDLYERSVLAAKPAPASPRPSPETAPPAQGSGGSSAVCHSERSEGSHGADAAPTIPRSRQASTAPPEQGSGDGAPEAPRKLTPEEMAQRFFDQAKKLAAMRDMNRFIGRTNRD